MIPDETLAQWQALADAATPGPWEADDTSVGVGNWWVAHVEEHDGPVTAEADAAFIAASRDAVPQLLDEVAELRRGPSPHRRSTGRTVLVGKLARRRGIQRSPGGRPPRPHRRRVVRTGCWRGSVKLPDWYLRMRKRWGGLVCFALSPNDLRCTRRSGHTGRHLATGFVDAFEVWP